MVNKGKPHHSFVYTLYYENDLSCRILIGKPEEETPLGKCLDGSTILKRIQQLNQQIQFIS
jgi:hypothetical protein